jgi:hypothetical protein
MSDIRHLSDTSYELMNEFMNDFDNLRIYKTTTEKQTINKYLKDIYKDLVIGKKYIDRLIKKTKPVFISKENKEASLLNSYYVSKDIKIHIKKYLTEYEIYSVNILGHDIELIFGHLNKKRQIKKYLRSIFLWLYYAARNSSGNCAKKLRIYIYLTPFKKELPNSQIKTLSPTNVNSAVTTSCVPSGEICIYREEEFLKVLIHESFHIFGLDFSNNSTYKLNKNIKKLFPIESEFNLFEGYSETWATILNISISVFNNSDGIDDYLLYTNCFLNFEQIFSLFQCVKVLDFMGLNYENLYKKDEQSEYLRKYLYKEKTNVFSYYIIKCMLLFNISDFLNWCGTTNLNLINFNNTPQNIIKFGKLIESFYNNPKFIEYINYIKYFKNCEIDKKGAYKIKNMLGNTLRMSLTEFN